MRQFAAKVHRDLPPTRMWGYDGCSPGPTFEARCGEALLIEWRNDLPAEHLFPIDHNLHGAEANKPDVRTVVHLHGGRTPPQFDGHPEAWFTPGHSSAYFYPNQQDAATLFYHDHAMGITRLNAMAGLVGLYLLRDETERALPLPTSRYEVPLVLYDRSFTADGQLQYPHPWVSEFIGNTILVNGKIAPFLDVEPRRYRFRVLKRQGPSAPGGQYDYVINGNMVAGFALLAYPAEYGSSGIMTFIVNQNGTVFQKDLGSDSNQTARQIAAYNPDSSWTPVEE